MRRRLTLALVFLALILKCNAMCPHDRCNTERLTPTDPNAGNNVVADFEKVMNGVLFALSANPQVGPLAFVGIGILQVIGVFQGGPNPYAIYRNELVAAQDYLACQMAAFTADLEIYIQGGHSQRTLLYTTLVHQRPHRCIHGCTTCKL
jgi:hypothetical protein